MVALRTTIFRQGYFSHIPHIGYNIVDVFASVMVAMVSNILIYKYIKRISNPLHIGDRHNDAG